MSGKRGRGAPGRGGSRGGRGGGGPPLSGAPRNAPQGRAHFEAASHVQAIGVRRPGFGVSGRQITVGANAAELTMPNEIIYHYDVVITPGVPAKVNLQIIKVLQADYATIFTPKAVYDGRKNLFTNHELDLGGDSKQFSIIIDQSRSADKPPLPYKVTITKAARINTAILDDFVNGRMTQNNEVQTSIMAINVVLRMELIQRYPFNTRSFFIPDGKKNVGYGLELWRGYFQSVRPAIGRIMVTLDTATAMFWKHGPLIPICLEHLGRPDQDPNLLAPSRGFPDRMKVMLQRFLTGMRFSTDGPAGEKKYTIRGISKEGASSIKFERNGQYCTIAQYFASTNRRLQYPEVICVKTSKGAYIPLERCRVLPGQIARKEVPPEIRNDLLAFSSQPPEQRFKAIKDGIPALEYGQSEYVRQFGIQVDTGPDSFPLPVRARVLAPPALQYAAAESFTPKFGTWNMANHKFVKPAIVKSWMIAIYEQERFFGIGDAKNFIRDFKQSCALYGIQMTDKNPYVKHLNGQQNILEELKKAGRECRELMRGEEPNLVVVILPNNGNDIYRAVKLFGNAAVGVATQCLIASKCKRAKEQYWANVLLKVNPKLGGVNWHHRAVPELSDPKNPTIIMGADVYHPPPGSSSPSFTSLVSSVDTKASFYIATDRMQGSRQEMIDDIQSMSADVLQKYRDYQSRVERRAGPVPTPRILFFRDGVSEGQFSQVKEIELPALRSACQSLNMNPKITLLVVGKRHHTRFMPSAQDADRTGNCPTGTVVDDIITHPVEFDFFLQSQPGLKGTSRPAHYTVLHDDNNFTADSIQSLCYSLCHLFARSTRAVSIPAPVYYADLACTQAKLRFEPLSALLSDTASSMTDDDVQRYQNAWKPLNEKMKTKMYYL